MERLFYASVLGQSADGTIDVASGYVYLTVTLPWLLAILTRAAEPLIDVAAEIGAIGRVLAAFFGRRARSQHC